MEFGDDLKERDKESFKINERTYIVTNNMPNNHYHPHYEILYIYENSRLLQISNKSFILDENNVALIPPFIPHMTISAKVDNKIEKRMLVNFRFNFVNDMSKVLDIDLLSGFNGADPVINIEAHKGRFQKLFALLKNDYERPEGEELKKLAKLHMTELLMLLRECRGTPETTDDMYSLVHYIEKNYQEHITLEELEKKFFMSKYTISRKFNVATGMSVPKYLAAIRIINAKQFIDLGQNITSIAFECGFSSLNDFDRVFKQETGMTPREYKIKSQSLREQ